VRGSRRSLSGWTSFREGDGILLLSQRAQPSLFAFQSRTTTGFFNLHLQKTHNENEKILMISEVLLWMFVVNLGIAFGAGLYEHRIVLPLWFERSSAGIHVNVLAMNNTDTGRKFWAFVSTGPLTLLTIANLVIAWSPQTARHEWLFAAALITLAERFLTFSYFIPTIIKLTRADAMPQEKSAVMASRWLSMNYVREALTLVGWLIALKALSLPG
jgi:hypothetical protein